MPARGLRKGRPISAENESMRAQERLQALFDPFNEGGSTMRLLGDFVMCSH